jgi:hypothetical protein
LLKKNGKSRVEKNPYNPRRSEAEKRIWQLRDGFPPKYFVTYQDKDFSGEIGSLVKSITKSRDEAATLVYVTTHQYTVGKYENGMSAIQTRVTVRLVDKHNLARERTITAESDPPEVLTVTRSRGDVIGEDGGHWSMNGKEHRGTRDQYELLLQSVLEYAETGKN